jgi:Fe2+ transport system protein FeoA
VSAPTSLGKVPGSEFVVLDVNLAESAQRRLAELGVRTGARVNVTQHTAGGGIVVSIGGSRIALDERTARGISVRASA